MRVLMVSVVEVCVCVKARGEWFSVILCMYSALRKHCEKAMLDKQCWISDAA